VAAAVVTVASMRGAMAVRTCADEGTPGSTSRRAPGQRIVLLHCVVMARRKQKHAPPPLHELESEVMEEMWRRETATVREVLEALNRGERQRAYTTVMTIMRRLDRKGLLTRERSGKTDIYRSVLSRDAYREARAQAEVQALVDEFGDLALAHFSEQMERLDSKRLRALRRLAK
jgi:predicted transcriptional regulator